MTSCRVELLQASSGVSNISAFSISRADSTPTSTMSVKRLSIIAALSVVGILLVWLWMNSTTYTYLKLHLFLLIPTLLLMFIPPFPLSNAPDAAMRHGRFLIPPMLISLAFVFSAPWENYLGSKGVLLFNASAVTGVLGYIPYEEYFWWVDHPLLATFWVMSIWRYKPVSKTGNPRFLFRTFAVLTCLAITYLGYILYDTGSNLYVSVTLMFVFPVMTIQYLLIGHLLLEHPHEWLLGTLFPSVHTILVDRFALQVGIWEISKERSTGIAVYGFLLEHLLAYSLTSAIAVQMVVATLRSLQLYKVRRYNSSSATEALTRMYTQG